MKKYLLLMYALMHILPSYGVSERALLRLLRRRRVFTHSWISTPRSIKNKGIVGRFEYEMIETKGSFLKYQLEKHGTDQAIKILYLHAKNQRDGTGTALLIELWNKVKTVVGLTKIYGYAPKRTVNFFTKFGAQKKYKHPNGGWDMEFNMKTDGDALKNLTKNP